MRRLDASLRTHCLDARTTRGRAGHWTGSRRAAGRPNATQSSDRLKSDLAAPPEAGPNQCVGRVSGVSEVVVGSGDFGQTAAQRVPGAGVFSATR
ncbi:hypothetical protein GCM10027199_70370 [Amycolatopsis magusensis]